MSGLVKVGEAGNEECGAGPVAVNRPGAESMVVIMAVCSKRQPCRRLLRKTGACGGLFSKVRVKKRKVHKKVQGTKALGLGDDLRFPVVLFFCSFFFPLLPRYFVLVRTRFCSTGSCSRGYVGNAADLQIGRVCMPSRAVFIAR